MTSTPDYPAAGPLADSTRETIEARFASPAQLAVERAIRGLKTAPPSHLRVFIPDAPAEVTVTSVLRKFADLRLAVSDLAQHLRSEGVPPERMLPQVKTVVLDVIASEGWKDRAAQELVMENMVRWAIDAYYAD